MCGECERCGEHALECVCDNYNVIISLRPPNTDDVYGRGTYWEYGNDVYMATANPGEWVNLSEPPYGG